MKASKMLRPVLGLLAASALSLSMPAEARITRIVIDCTTSPTIGGVAYTQLYGRIFGELDPADSHNTIIQDIGLAAARRQRQGPLRRDHHRAAPQQRARPV